MKIIGFTQAHNEMEKNKNLINFLKSMNMCDSIYIYDQASTDNSREVYEANTKCKVIYSPINDFINENKCKSILLQKLLLEQPDADFILWNDVDNIIDGRYQENNFELFFKMCEEAKKEDVDGVAFGHYNVWRSSGLFYRTDEMWHQHHRDGGRVSLWRNNGKLFIDPVPGLHKSPLPRGLDKIKRVDCNLIHMGFSTDFQIMKKFHTYKKLGQTGYQLMRIVNEQGLQVEELPREYLPEWFDITDTINPMTKKRLVDIFPV